MPFADGSVDDKYWSSTTVKTALQQLSGTCWLLDAYTCSAALKTKSWAARGCNTAAFGCFFFPPENSHSRRRYYFKRDNYFYTRIRCSLRPVVVKNAQIRHRCYLRKTVTKWWNIYSCEVCSENVHATVIMKVDYFIWFTIKRKYMFIGMYTYIILYVYMLTTKPRTVI